jgi:hypothetical protein
MTTAAPRESSPTLLEDDEESVTGLVSVTHKEATSLEKDREKAITQSKHKLQELRKHFPPVIPGKKK